MLALFIFAAILLYAAFVISQHLAIGGGVNHALQEGGALAKLIGKWARKQFRDYRPEVMKFGYLFAVAHVAIGLAAMLATLRERPHTILAVPLWAACVVAASSLIAASMIVVTIQKPKGRESLFALMGVSASVTILTGIVTLCVSAVSGSSILAIFAFLTLVGGVLLLWMYARLCVEGGVKIADLTEGVLNTGASFLRLMANAFGNEHFAAAIKDANPFNEDAYIEKLNRLFRPLMSSVAAVTLSNALLPNELHLFALSLASAHTEVNCFRYEAQGMDVTSRRRRSIVVFDGWSFLLLLNFARRLVFFEHPAIQTSYWFPIVNAIKSISASVIQYVFWLVAAGLCALLVKYLPRLFGTESKFLPWLTRTAFGLALFGCLITFGWNLIKNPVERAAEKAAVSYVQDVIPTVEATGGTVRVSWSALQTEEGNTIRVERRGIKDTGFVTVQTLSAGTTKWEDEHVSPGRTYFYRLVIRNEQTGKTITTREKEVTVPSVVTASSSDAGSVPETSATSVAAATPAPPPAPTTCPDGNCGMSDDLASLCTDSGGCP